MRQKELVVNVLTFIWLYAAISTNTLTPMIMPAVTFTMNPLITSVSLDLLVLLDVALPALIGGAGGVVDRKPKHHRPALPFSSAPPAGGKTF